LLLAGSVRRMRALRFVENFGNEIGNAFLAADQQARRVAGHSPAMNRARMLRPSQNARIILIPAKASRPSMDKQSATCGQRAVASGLPHRFRRGQRALSQNTTCMLNVPMTRRGAFGRVFHLMSWSRLCSPHHAIPDLPA
jgi:hypothetical protein